MFEVILTGIGLLIWIGVIYWRTERQYKNDDKD